MTENADTPQVQEPAADADSSLSSNPATEAKAGETQQQPAADDGAAKTDEQSGAPIEYKFTHPVEGAEFDSAVVDAFTEVVSGHKISQEAAQDILGKMTQVINERQVGALEALRSGWRDELAQDKEIGGDKLAESMATARKSFQQFGGDDALKLLDESGLGDHPAIVRMFYKVGKAISEDTFVAAGNSPGQQTNPAKIMYPNMN